MINENFKPVEHKFVETPYAEMLKHGMMQQANYDEAVGAMAEYDAKLGALKRVDEDTYQKVMSKYDQDFRDMYNQYGGDWGAMKNRVKQRLGAETANPYYNLNRAHVEEYEKMQDLNRQLRANGKSPLTFSKVPLSLIKDGKLIKAEDIKYNIEGKLGWDEKEREIANFALQEEHNSGETSLAGLTDEDVVKLGNKLYLETVKTTTSGIGEKQVLNKINNMFANLMDTKEGKQKYRALMNSEEFGINGATPHLVEAKMKEDLLKTAYLKIHQSYDVDRQTIGNAAYGKSGGGSEKKPKAFITNTGIDEKAVKHVPNTFERAIEKANEYKNSASEWEKKLKEFDEKSAKLNEKSNTVTGKTGLTNQSGISKKRKTERENIIKNIESAKKAQNFWSNSAVKNHEAAVQFARLMGYKIDKNDPRSVQSFLKVPGVSEAFDASIRNRSAYLQKRVPIVNPSFTNVMNQFLSTQSEQVIIDGKPQKLVTKPGSKTSYEYLTGTNELVIAYTDKNGETQRAPVVKTSLPDAVRLQIEDLKKINNDVNEYAAGVPFTAGGLTIKKIYGSQYIKNSGTNVLPNGEKVNPLDPIFMDSKGDIYTPNDLREGLVNGIEAVGSVNHSHTPEKVEEVFDMSTDVDFNDIKSYN
jgi:hypothetical protein